MAVTCSTHAVTHVKIHHGRTTFRPLERPVAPGNDFENWALGPPCNRGLWAVRRVTREHLVSVLFESHSMKLAFGFWGACALTGPKTTIPLVTNVL